MHPWVQEVEDLEVAKRVQYLANQHLGNSVLRTGFLPRWQFNLENQQMYDFSGLGGVGQQETSFRLPKWHNINTDNMVLGYEYGKTPHSANAPFQDGVNLALNDYLEEIVDGFQQMYRFLMEHRQAILAPDSPLTTLAKQSVRFVFRATKIYDFILVTTLDPKFMRDGAERSIQLDILSRALLLSNTKPLFWPLLSVEQQALEQLDIPLFTARSDSEALTVAPNQTIDKCFTEPSFNLVVSRLNQLNARDLEQQIGFIQGSLYSRMTGETHHASRVHNSPLNLEAVAPLTKQEMVEQAMAIAAKLQKQAIRSKDGSTTWIAPQYIFEAQRFQLLPMSHGFYDGGCGIALFLTAIEKVTGTVEFSDLGLGALQSLYQDLQEPAFAQVLKEIGIGGAVGYGSIIYALIRSSQFLKETALIQNAKQAASLITSDLIAADQNFDIISGSAGAILGLLALHNVSADQEVLEQAVACGYHLLEHRVASDLGYKVWATFNGKLLTGFSHGAAGIAYALLRLYQVTGETPFLEAAQEAIAYERSVFIPEEGNWPDFRESGSKKHPTCICSWCHGAPGIGLARVATLDILDTPEIRQDIEVAINTTKRHGLSEIDHLCCGNMGRIEFLFTAGRKLSRPDLIEEAMKQAVQVVVRTQQRGHFGYGSILDFHPGFFQGASGKNTKSE